MPGALKTLAFNKSMSHKEGIKLFEISDIVVPAGEFGVWRSFCLDFFFLTNVFVYVRRYITINCR